MLRNEIHFRYIDDGWKGGSTVSHQPLRLISHLFRGHGSFLRQSHAGGRSAVARYCQV